MWKSSFSIATLTTYTQGDSLTHTHTHLQKLLSHLRIMESPKSYFVLIGGESCDTQGANVHTREYLHTSLSFVAQVSTACPVYQ